MSSPLISIVTPCLNRAGLVRDAIESVLAQNYPSLEHIVVDGGSTDGTLGTLREFSHLRVISEPDDGMYDAINKGIKLAKGEIIGLLNTDDVYLPGALKSAAQAFEQNPDALAVVGGTQIVDAGSGKIKVIESYKAIEPDEIWFRLIQGHPCTNAWFFKRKVFDLAGYFDTRFRYASDRYFLIHIVLDAGVLPVPVHEMLYQYRQHSGSATMTTLDSREEPYGLLRIKILWEDITALEGFLAREGLPDEVRRRMKREHGERCYRCAVTSAWHCRWSDCLRAVGHGFRQNMVWPLIFVDMAFARLKKEVRPHVI